jgi:DNA-binding XRE family transcriptional regulator
MATLRRVFERYSESMMTYEVPTTVRARGLLVERLKRGLLCKDAALEAGIDECTLHRLETEHDRFPSLNTFLKIAKVYGGVDAAECLFELIEVEGVLAGMIAIGGRRRRSMMERSIETARDQKGGPR